MTSSVTWLGHATVLVDLDGTRVVTDPVLRRRIIHLYRSKAVAAPPDLDGVLVSHLHYDHLDRRSLKFARDLPFVVPRGAARYLRSFAHVIEVVPGDTVDIGSLQVTAVEAEHDGRRGRWGDPVEALGFVVRGSRTIYFAGDTDLFDGMAAFASPDLALLPVAGWGPTLGPGHMDPQRAAEALKLIRPAMAIPIHWGTYRAAGTSDRGDLPARTFAAAAALAAPEVEVRVVPPGGSVSL
jgi:L-ascorbate metabolism protein UlaG (beta-lactamase superfamily)